MPTWTAKCQNCGIEAIVYANSEDAAISLAKDQHAKYQGINEMCGSGPAISKASNLDEAKRSTSGNKP